MQISRIIRETDMPEIKCHDDTIIKIFVIEPNKKNNIIVEDSKYDYPI